MKEKANKITVEIFGESYPIKGSAEVDQVKRAAAAVDARMRQIADVNSRLSPAKIAVITALNFADDYIKLEKDYRKLLQLLKEEKPGRPRRPFP